MPLHFFYFFLNCIQFAIQPFNLHLKWVAEFAEPLFFHVKKNPSFQNHYSKSLLRVQIKRLIEPPLTQALGAQAREQ